MKKLKPPRTISGWFFYAFITKNEPLVKLSLKNFQLSLQAIK